MRVRRLGGDAAAAKLVEKKRRSVHTTPLNNQAVPEASRRERERRRRGARARRARTNVASSLATRPSSHAPCPTSVQDVRTGVYTRRI